MGGDSIAQARRALSEILELLRPEDVFNVVRFGSAYQMLFPSPLPAAAGNLKTARNLLEVLDADIGGNEIGPAVAAAIKGAKYSELSQEALLITDGEVGDWEKVTKVAAKSGVRFFTVGVGSSVSEAFLQTLADVTGGALAQKGSLKNLISNQTPIGLPRTTARMAAAFEMRALEDPGEIAALGVRYQLMSSYTNYLAIDVKSEGEKAGDLPALRKPPQMLAAGWGLGNRDAGYGPMQPP